MHGGLAPPLAAGGSPLSARRRGPSWLAAFAAFAAPCSPCGTRGPLWALLPLAAPCGLCGP
eukprot:4926846-Lingulodinium_polyedra.AAC.1